MIFCDCQRDCCHESKRDHNPIPGMQPLGGPPVPPRLSGRQRQALVKLLRSISGMSGARWDQWLRYDVGDEDTDALMLWLSRNIDPELGRKPY